MTSRDESRFRAVFDHALDAIVLFDDELIVAANPAVEAVLGVAPHELVGRRAAELADAEGVLLRLREERTLRGERSFRAPDGRLRWVEFTAIADFLPGCHLAVARDCTERKGGEEALRRRAAQQAAIADLGLLALGRPAPGRLLDEVVARVASTLAIEFVSLFERIGDGLLLRAGRGWERDAVGRAVIGLEPESQAARTLAAGEAVAGDDPGRGPELLRRHGVVSGVTVAIRGRDGPWGILGAHSAAPRRFTRPDVDFLRAAANTLAMATERAADEDEITRLARERQRIAAQALDAEDRAQERISQELHDDLLQSLFVIRQDLAEALGGTGGAELVERAHAGVQQAIRSLRGAVLGLHPVVLDRGGLRAAVTAAVDHQAGVGGFEARVDVAPDAGGAHDRLALSLVREFVSNAARHAGARHVTVLLGRRDGALVLEVADDGRGMDPDLARQAVAHGHIGLASAVQRVEAVGGSLQLRSRVGDGTTVRVSLPAA